MKETVLKDVKEFLGSEKWYADRGIPVSFCFFMEMPTRDSEYM